MINHTFNKNG